MHQSEFINKLCEDVRRLILSYCGPEEKLALLDVNQQTQYLLTSNNTMPRCWNELIAANNWDIPEALIEFYYRRNFQIISSYYGQLRPFVALSALPSSKATKLSFFKEIYRNSRDATVVQDVITNLVNEGDCDVIAHLAQRLNKRELVQYGLMNTLIARGDWKVINTMLTYALQNDDWNMVGHIIDHLTVAQLSSTDFVDILTPEFGQFLKYLFIYNKLPMLPDEHVYTTNAGFGLQLALLFIQGTASSLIQNDSRQRYLEIRQLFFLALISSLVGCGLLCYDYNLLVANVIYDDVALLLTPLCFLIKNMVTALISAPNHPDPLELICLTICITPLSTYLCLGVFALILIVCSSFMSLTMLTTLSALIFSGVIDALMFEFILEENNPFISNDTWLQQALLSTPGLVLVGICAQPFFLLAFGGTIAALITTIAIMTAFYCLLMPTCLMLSLIEPDECWDLLGAWCESMVDVAEWYISVLNDLQTVWLESVGVRTFGSLDVGLSAENLKMKQLAREIVFAEAQTNTTFSPKEHLIYLLQQYSQQNRLSFFFNTHPHLAFVNELLHDLQSDDSTLTEIDFKMDQYHIEHPNVDKELVSIAQYNQYVLLPMEEKANFHANPSRFTLQECLPVLHNRYDVEPYPPVANTPQAA